jgi:hypothetical protein
MSNIPKPFNYSPLQVNNNITIEANTYNVIYCQSASPIYVQLPSINDSIDGFPVNIRNFATGTVSVQLYETGEEIITVQSNEVVFLVLDKQEGVNIWRDIYGPTNITGNGNVSGPGDSTTNAIVRWTSDSGLDIKDSTVFINNLGDISGANNIIADGNVTAKNNLTLSNTTSYLYFRNPSYSGSAAIRCTPPASSTNVVWTLPNVNDQFVGRNTSDTLANKTIMSAANNVSANNLMATLAGDYVNINSGSLPTVGQALIATATNVAQWRDIPIGVVGPSTSTPTALARWSNVSGTALLDSNVTLNVNGDLTGVRNCTMSGNLIISGNEQVFGTLGLVRDGSNAILLQYSALASGLNTLNFPATTSGIDSAVYANTTATLTAKTIIDSASIIYANALKTTGAAVIISAAIPPTVGQVLTATSATTAAWQTPPTPMNTNVTTISSRPSSVDDVSFVEMMYTLTWIETPGTISNVEFVKSGRVCTMFIEAANFPAAKFTSVAAIPTEYMPRFTSRSKGEIIIPIYTYDTAGTITLGKLTINSVGIVMITSPNTISGWPDLTINFLTN